MRISDWSSDVCSSDLFPPPSPRRGSAAAASTRAAMSPSWRPPPTCSSISPRPARSKRSEERRVGKECVIRVDLGGRRNLKKKKTHAHSSQSLNDTYVTQNATTQLTQRITTHLN